MRGRWFCSWAVNASGEIADVEAAVSRSKLESVKEEEEDSTEGRAPLGRVKPTFSTFTGFVFVTRNVLKGPLDPEEDRPET